jgi:glycosyltransferase involved in cell wall biosynthesis
VAHSPVPSSAVPKVALVHDFLLDVRGAERVFAELCRMWPEADVFTAVYDEEGTEGRFADRDVRTSFLQRLRPSARSFRVLLPLYPRAIESFDFSGYDLVISSSSAWAHGVVCRPPTLHVSYCHNPFRYAWNEREVTVSSRRNPVTRRFLDDALTHWRHWDYRAARRTDRYVANSEVTQARLRVYFQRESQIVYPPVETARFFPGRAGDHYAIVAELMPHKQIGVAIAAFNALRRPLVVVGDGPAARSLRREAGPTITFTGRVSDQEVAEILAASRALVLTSVEEFGIAAVESQAAGRPVIARRGGGALETVIDGVTGCFWAGGPDQLAATIRRFDDGAINPSDCLRNAARFDVQSFRAGFLDEIAAAEGGLRNGADPNQPPDATRLMTLAAQATGR